MPLTAPESRCVGGNLLVTLVIVMLPSVVKAATYYVDSAAGDNLQSGESPVSAWRTIKKVFAYSSDPGFRPGDNILFKRGQEFAAGGEANVDYVGIFGSSGTAGAHIVFDAYGEAQRGPNGDILNNPLFRIRATVVPSDAWVPADVPGVWKYTARERVGPTAKVRAAVRQGASGARLRDDGVPAAER